MGINFDKTFLRGTNLYSFSERYQISTVIFVKQKASDLHSTYNKSQNSKDLSNLYDMLLKHDNDCFRESYNPWQNLTYPTRLNNDLNKREQVQTKKTILVAAR